MILTKIHSDDCHICMELGDKGQALAEKEGFGYEKIDLEILSKTPGSLKDYVVGYHVSGVDGMIDLPIYIISTDDGNIQASGVVQDLSEVSNLIFSWNKWASCQKPSSAD